MGAIARMELRRPRVMARYDFYLFCTSSRGVHTGGMIIHIFLFLPNIENPLYSTAIKRGSRQNENQDYSDYGGVGVWAPIVVITSHAE